MKNAHERMQNEYEEDDEKLREFLKNHDTEIGVKEREKVRLQEQCERLKRELNEKEGTLESLQIKKGKMEQMIQDHRNKQRQLLSRLETLCANHGINKESVFGRGQDTDPEEVAAKMMETMIGLQGAKREELEQFQREQMTMEKEIAGDIQQKQSKRQGLQFQANALREQQRQSRSKREQFQRELNGIERQLRECKNIESQITAMKAKVNEFERNDRTKEWNQQMTDCQKNTLQNQKTMDKLNKERQSLQSQSEELTALRIKSEQYNKAKQTYDASSSAIKSKITSVMQNMPPMDRLQREFNQKRVSLQNEYEECQQQFNRLETQHQVAQSKESSIKNEADKLRRSLQQNQKRLRDGNVVLGQNPDASIQAAREVANAKNADWALAKCGRTLYSKFNNLAKKKHQCPVCQRRFGSDSELQHFVKINSNRIEAVEKSGAIAKHEKEYKAAQQQLEALQSKVPIWENTKQQQKQLEQLLREKEKISAEAVKVERVTMRLFIH